MSEGVKASLTRIRRFSKSTVKLSQPAVGETEDNGDLSERWSKQVYRIDLEARNRYVFPADNEQLVRQLQLTTNNYLHAQFGHGSRNSQGSTRMLGLVRVHDAKITAFLACAHVLLRSDAVDLLCAFHRGEHAHVPAIDVLRLIIYTRQCNRDAITDLEGGWADTLLCIMMRRGTHRDLLLRVELLLQARSPTSGIFGRLLELIPQSACEEFTASLKGLSQTREWANAHRASAWLSKIPTNSPLCPLLDSVYPAWTAWAKWRPDTPRIRKWQNLTKEERPMVWEILDLEGPDFELRRYDTHGASIARPGSAEVQIGGLTLNSKTQPLVETEQCLRDLTSCLDAVIDTKDVLPKILAWFGGLYRTKDLDVTILRSLACAAACENRRLFAIAYQLQILSPYSAGMNLVLEKLPLLEGVESPPARRALGPAFARTVEAALKTMQTKLHDHVKFNNNPEVIGQRVIKLVSTINKYDWLCSYFAESTRGFLGQIPPADHLSAIFELRARAEDLSLGKSSYLYTLIDNYCLDSMAPGFAAVTHDNAIPRRLALIWTLWQDEDRRNLALDVAACADIPISIRDSCLNKGLNVPDRLVPELRKVLGVPSYVKHAHFAHCLAQHLNDAAVRELEPWHNLFLWMLKRSEIMRGVGVLSLSKWFGWVQDLKILKAHWRDQSTDEILFLSMRFFAWADRLAKHHLRAMERLEEHIKIALKLTPDLQWIFTGINMQAKILPTLVLLDPSISHWLSPFVERILKSPPPGPDSAERVYKLLTSFYISEPSFKGVCARVIDLCKEKEKETAVLYLADFRKRSTASKKEQAMLAALAKAFGLRFASHGESIEIPLQTVVGQFDARFERLIEDVEGLEIAKRSLLLSRPRQAAQILQQLGVHSHAGSPSDLSHNIPDHLVDYVEEIDHNTHELFFPLDKLKKLQKKALDIQDAAGIIVQFASSSTDETGSFCVHLHLSPGASVGAGVVHQMTAIKYAGTRPIPNSCVDPDIDPCGSGPNRFLYQLRGSVQRFLSSHRASVEQMYAFIDAQISDIGSNCIACGKKMNADLFRSTLCGDGCRKIWSRTSPEMRLQDVRTDPRSVDCLLTAFHAAANSKNSMQWLTGCPISSKQSLLEVLDRLKPTSLLSQVVDLTAAVKGIGEEAEELLPWILENSGGFFTSPIEEFKIPNMGGIHQFLLANSTPQIHRAFAGHSQRTRVVFHGTSLDRLFPILREGFRIFDDLSLKQNRDPLLRELYFSHEPTHALDHSTQARDTWRHSSFKDTRVVLGCELASQSLENVQVTYVVDDPTMVIVRYIFLFPMGVDIPHRRDIEPAMTAAFRELRLGAT